MERASLRWRTAGTSSSSVVTTTAVGTSTVPIQSCDEKRVSASTASITRGGLVFEEILAHAVAQVRVLDPYQHSLQHSTARGGGHQPRGGGRDRQCRALRAAASASSASIQRLGAERTAGSEIGLLAGRQLRRQFA
jgi:hypothetical protein